MEAAQQQQDDDSLIHLQRAEMPPREEVFMEGPLVPNMGPSLADVLCVHLNVLMQCFLHFL
jgi:hypothetical protein